MRDSTRRKMRSCFEGFRAKRTGSRCSKPALSAPTTFPSAAARRHGDANYELAARHRCHLDALQGRIHGFNVSVAHVWAD